MMMENNQEKENNESSESQVSSPVGTVLNAPKFGFVIPNRVFVGGISSQTTENDLAQLFSNYGNVVNTKIIADRAGVSKGYGFVTFETEEEARRIQNDSYQRPYEGTQPVSGSPVPMASGQMYRQPGVPYYQNGMAFYAPVGAPAQQPPQTMTPVQSPVEPPHVYPPGAYGGVAQNTSAPNFTFSYPNPIYYQAHYPYHVTCNGLGYVGHPEGMPGHVQPAYMEGYPVSEGTHVAPNNVIIPAGGAESGGVVFAGPPYIFAQQPATQHQQYFEPQPQNMSPMPQAATQQEPAPQMFYSSARGYEPQPFVYADSSSHQPASDGSPSASNTPLSLPPPTAAGTQDELKQEPPRFPLHIPEMGSSRGGRPSRGRGRGGPGRGGTKQYPPVPTMPYIPGMRPHYGMIPITQHLTAPRRGGAVYRGKYSGRGGKPMKGQPWSYRDANDSAEEGSVLANALTPPITPRSPHDPTEDLSASLQGLNI